MENLFLRFPEGKKKALTLSYDDGKEQDIRLVTLLRKNGIKGTFNLNSGGLYEERKPDKRITLTKQEARELYLKNEMEVAVHSLTHPHLELLSADRCFYEIIKDRENLEEWFGTLVRGMAYPFGTFSDEVLKCLHAAGIVYARTTRSSENFQLPDNWLLLNPTCHHDHPKLMQFAQKFVEDTPSLDPWLFYLWGHSYEFEEKNNWEVIERFAAYTGNRKDIWYASNIELYEYTEAYRHLLRSLNGKRLYNPSARTVYFEKEGTVMCIDPGETITF